MQGPTGVSARNGTQAVPDTVNAVGEGFQPSRCTIDA